MAAITEHLLVDRENPDVTIIEATPRQTTATKLLKLKPQTSTLLCEQIYAIFTTT